MGRKKEPRQSWLYSPEDLLGISAKHYASTDYVELPDGTKLECRNGLDATALAAVINSLVVVQYIPGCLYAPPHSALIKVTDLRESAQNSKRAMHNFGELAESIENAGDKTPVVIKRVHTTGPLRTKTLETVGGSFVTFHRRNLEKGGRKTLTSYLEKRGHAVYHDETIDQLRPQALEDYDGETDQPEMAGCKAGPPIKSKR